MTGSPSGTRSSRSSPDSNPTSTTAAGVHLLLPPDPEIGSDGYLRLCGAMMGGREPYPAGQSGLRMSPLDARRAIACVDDQQREAEKAAGDWSYLILAPHPFTGVGFLASTKAQVLEEFPCDRLAAYELPDGKLPEDFGEGKKPGSFLRPFMRRHRQPFFHASDAYRVEPGPGGTEAAIGRRFTWLKLASPRVEALRQAFIASDSRLRIAYERGEDGELRELGTPPYPPAYPWLRSVTVAGGASFFGGQTDDGPVATTFDLSPDLTCLIGGSMTGKSTLLDGLRIHLGAPLPSDEKLASQVRERGKNVLLAGSPKVD